MSVEHAMYVVKAKYSVGVVTEFPIEKMIGSCVERPISRLIAIAQSLLRLRPSQRLTGR